MKTMSKKWKIIVTIAMGFFVSLLAVLVWQAVSEASMIWVGILSTVIFFVAFGVFVLNVWYL